MMIMRTRFVSVAALPAAGPMAVTGLSPAAWPAPDSPRLTAASLSAASAAGQAPRSGSAAGAIVLVAVAVAAVGAFTVLQIMARSGRRRVPAGGGRRARAACDWRTLPPQYQADAGRAGTPAADHDGYGPLWRYGSPHGYARDYGPGHSPDHGPGYAPDARPPWSTPGDAPHER